VRSHARGLASANLIVLRLGNVADDVGKQRLVKVERAPRGAPPADVVLVEPSAALLALPGPSESTRAIQAYLRTQLSPRSRQNAMDALRRLARILSRGTHADPTLFPWSSIDYEVATTIRTALFELTRTNTITPGTANLTLSHLRGLIRTMYGMGLVDARQHEFTHSDALKGIKGKRIPRGRALAPREERALREAAGALGGYHGPMLDTAIVLAVGAGLRREEVATLAVDGLTSEAVTIVGKGNKERSIPVDEQMQDATDVWLNKRQALAPKHDKLFCSPHQSDRVMSPWSFWSLVRTAAHGAFGDKQKCDEGCKCLVVVTGPHDFRRTFATRLLEQGLDLGQVQELMGHESPETTSRYDKRDVEALFEKRRKMRIIA